MVTIEKYDAGMIQGLWDVYFTSIRLVCCNDYSREQIEAWAPESFDISLFKETMNKLNPFVAISAGKVIGYTDLQEDGLIDHFYVHGEFQGKGAGKKLMESVLVKGESYPKLYSHVSHTAKPFYLKYGFSVSKVKNDEVRGVQIENNLMVKEN
jgi:putative acetyltransferase